MPISAIGNSSPAFRRPETEAGFTLVEIMVVLTIVGLTAAVAALALPDGGAAARQEAERLGARLLAARDHALFTQSETAAVIDAAQAEALRITARATEAADRAAAARTTEVEAAARTLAARIAARLLDRLPVGARLDGFIDGFAQALDGLPDAVKRRFTDGGETLVLLAATEVSAATRATLEAAIGRVLGSVPPLEIRVEPALIAGFEAAADHAVVTNSFRADLAQIAREFARDDRQ